MLYQAVYIHRQDLPFFSGKVCIKSQHGESVRFAGCRQSRNSDRSIVAPDLVLFSPVLSHDQARLPAGRTMVQLGQQGSSPGLAFGLVLENIFGSELCGLPGIIHFVVETILANLGQAETQIYSTPGWYARHIAMAVYMNEGRWMARVPTQKITRTFPTSRYFRRFTRYSMAGSLHAVRVPHQ